MGLKVASGPARAVPPRAGESVTGPGELSALEDERAGSSMDTSDIRKGLKIMMDGQPFIVVEFQFVKPGKGQAFTRTKMKNLLTGRQHRAQHPLW